MSSTTSEKTIETLHMLFARYGVPAQLVSDNGPQLKSEEFEQFLKRNGIKHITSAPYHPATNGLAERRVESFKNGRKSETEVKSLNIKLAKFLLLIERHRRAAVPFVFGKKTTHSTGPVKTRSQHSGKQSPDRPVCRQGWFWNASFFHWPKSDSTKLLWTLQVGTEYCPYTTD